MKDNNFYEFVSNLNVRVNEKHLNALLDELLNGKFETIKVEKKD